MTLLQIYYLKYCTAWLLTMNALIRGGTPIVGFEIDNQTIVNKWSKVYQILFVSFKLQLHKPNKTNEVEESKWSKNITLTLWNIQRCMKHYWILWFLNCNWNYYNDYSGKMLPTFFVVFIRQRKKPFLAS